MDHVLEYMQKHNKPLELAYFENPPEELSAEQGAELPEEFQVWHSDD